MILDCFATCDLERSRRLKFYSTVTGAVLLHIVIGATQYGNIITYITSYIRFYVSNDNNYGRNIWISSITVLAFTIFTIISGYMTRKVPFRGVLFLGVTLISLSNLLTAFSVNGSYEYLLLTFGFGQSAGCGLIYSIVIVTSVKWNPNYRGFITGLIVALDAVSTFFTMYLQTAYFNPENIAPDQDGYFVDTTVLLRVPVYFKFASVLFFIIGTVGVFMMFLPEQQQSSTSGGEQTAVGSNYDTIDEHLSAEGREEDLLSTTSSGVFPRGKSLTEDLIENDILGILKEEFDRDEELITSSRFREAEQSGETQPLVVKNYYGVRKALRTRMALILFITFGLSTNSSYFISAMGKPYGQTFIKDDHYLATVIAFSNLANCFGSFFCGRLLDRIKFKRTMIIVNCTVAASYFSFITCYYHAHKVLYGIWIMILGFSSIGFFSSHLPEVMNKYGEKHATAIYGVIHTGPVISSLALSPVFEILVNYYGWFPTFLTVGFLNTASMIILMIFYRAHTVI